VLAITIPVCTVLVFASPWILRVAVGKSLQAPLSLLIVLAVWCVVNAVYVVSAILLNGAGVLKAQSALAIIVGVCNLALSIFLTRRYGVIGVCLGSIITQLMITFPTYLFLIPRLFTNLSRIRIVNGSQGVTSLA
jgi:O-antigen/teichoic acid export membrane protein